MARAPTPRTRYSRPPDVLSHRFECRGADAVPVDGLRVDRVHRFDRGLGVVCASRRFTRLGRRHRLADASGLWGFLYLLECFERA